MTPALRKTACRALRRSAPWRAISAVVVIVPTLFVPLTAQAAECDPATELSTCVDVDELWFRAGNSVFLTGGGGTTTPAGSATFGLATSYSRRPLVLLAFAPDVNPREAYVIDNLLTSTFTFGLGVTDALEVTAAVPVTFYQDGSGYAAFTGSEAELTRSVLRDPRFGFVWAPVQRERTRDASGFALALRFDLGIPLGEESEFAGVRGATFVPSASASYRLPPFEAKVEAEARVRREEQISNVFYGSQLGVTAGVSVEAYAPIRLSFSAEAFALPALSEQGDQAGALVPGEWLASARVAPFLSGDFFFQTGGGTGLPFTNSSATAPELRAVFSLGYAPRGLDTDGDAVLDRDDACVETREDRDGFEDQDGCADPDNDKDDVLDGDDRCRDAAETVDGFEDEDGCPDLDDDGDEIPDEEDTCRNDREDLDGFEDQDGCPDPDNDKDDVLDGADKCPREAEDKDGFRDEDGCPEGDDDGDGIPDASDSCPRSAEDIDTFEDQDGCPDVDNDKDGILDGADLCPTEPETLDGAKDDDGCPEPNAQNLAKVRSDGTIEAVTPPRFAAKRSDVTPELSRLVNVVASIAKGQARGGKPIRIIVEAYGDTAGDEKLAGARAAAIQRALVKAGVAEAQIVAAAGDPAGSQTKGAHVDFSIAKEE